MTATASQQNLRVLVVDDEPNIADVISMALRYEGFDVETASNGADALAEVESYRPHLMVLDIMLPDMEGFEVARRLGGERAELPIVFLTARDTQEDKIRGLTTGGDDYVTKPFSLEELVARIRVILRRTGHSDGDSSKLSFADLELDEDTREITRAGRPIELTATEYRLLRYLLLNPRRVLTRSQLLDHVWDYDFGGDARVLETYISYLRKKVDADGPPLIHTVRGVGYSLRLPRVSLRTRLIAALVVLAAVGLVTLAAVTYAEQRSFLLERADQQASQAQDLVSRQLDVQLGGGVPPGFGLPPAFLRGSGPPGDPEDGNGPGRMNLQPGTYGQRRTLTGRVLTTTVAGSPTGDALPALKLPSSIPLDRAITVDAVSGNLRYRVLARVTHDDRSTVTLVAVPLTEADQTLSRLLRVEGLVIAGVLVLLAALAWWVVRLGLRPLDRMGETAGAIAAGDLSRRVEPTSERTEVGRLGLSLNAMLAQIERAFAERQASENRLRQFLADASHELRTPLASIRGYAELFRIGAARKPADTEKAMGRIEDESARMGALVENLLTLARLDQIPDIARKPVDLSRLASDATDDARAIAPDREVDLRSDAAVTVMGDQSQLRQVLGNLMRNALVHTPAGTPIEVNVRAAGPEVVVEVRDHGNGLPTDDHDALFERFWRADPGRERGRGGAGLGLSIVAAIVDAHGGSVGAANAPGGGASFTIRLPAAQQSAADFAPAAAPA